MNIQYNTVNKINKDGRGIIRRYNNNNNCNNDTNGFDDERMKILIDRVVEKSGGRIARWIYISLLFDTIITERIYHYLEGKIEVQITSHASLFELYIFLKFDLIYNSNNITEKGRSFYDILVVSCVAKTQEKIN